MEVQTVCTKRPTEVQDDQNVSVHLTITVQNNPHTIWWVEDGHHRIHS